MVNFVEDGGGVQAGFGRVSRIVAFCDGYLSVLEEF